MIVNVKEKVLDSPCIEGRCSHILNEDIIEEDIEPWVAYPSKPLPTIDGKDGSRNVYRFNKLFQHLPILLEEIAKNDYKLRSEVDATRKILLQVMERELRAQNGTFSYRMLAASLDHIVNLQDLSEVENASIRWLTIFLDKYSGLQALDLWNREFEKKLANAVVTNQVAYSELLRILSEVAIRTLHQNLIEYSINKGESMLASSDRRVLLSLAGFFANIAKAYSSRKAECDRGTELARRAEDILKKICLTEDLLCS